MKVYQTWCHIVALMLAMTLIVGGLSACKDPVNDDNPATLANGNVVTLATEQGSEEELTAVRDNLIKLSETKGFGEIDKMEFYENGVRTTSDQYIQVKDNKKFYYSGDVKRVVNYPDGYILDMPAEWKPDFTMAQARCLYQNDDVTLAVSNETDSIRIYGTSENYVDEIFQFVNNDRYYRVNRVTKLKDETIDIGEYKARVIKMSIDEIDDSMKRFYTHVVCYDELNIVQMMFKCVDDRDFSDVYMTFRAIYDKGEAINAIAYPEGDNPSWNEATKEVYHQLKNRDTVMWGAYNGNIEDDPLKIKYKTLEMQIDHKFELVTSYTDNVDFDFPVEDAQKIHDDGRLIQFTHHFETGWGSQLGDKSPLLDVYRGEYDEEFREFARGVVEFGQPMLFRVNNEMNSDWTTWSAVNNMLDPDIFVDTWIRVYNILEEEGANQYLIWVWNPQGATTAPMANWNDVMLYHPGARYVDVLGLTAYNFGDENTWDTFEDMYTYLENYYKPIFGDWVWMISEFGCSDSTDDETRKATWITDMFDCFEAGKFPNIKAAVWFNANDYYADGTISHEISLGRDKPAQEAFKEGLDRTQ